MSSTRTSNSSSSSARSQPTKKVNGNTVTFAKSSKESANEYGIDCGPDLLWKGWSVGGEYTKKLVIRNISTRTIEIKCRIPASVDFFMEFPEWFKLSPGVSQAINVTFRPTAEKRYHDKVIVCTRDGGEFPVAVKAVLANMAFRLPSKIDLGYCATNEISRQDFLLENTGELPFDFDWNIMENAKSSNQTFQIQPVRGRLDAGESTPITISFVPTAASVYNSVAICKIPGQTKTIDIVGVGKYPFIVVKQQQVDFGRIHVGSSNTQNIVLENRSIVPASYIIQPIERDLFESVFFFTPNQGYVPPNSTTTLKATYEPVTTESFDLVNFEIKTPGGNKLKVTLQGYGVGPDITLSNRSVNFGDVSIEKKPDPIKRVFTVTNNSDVDAAYDFKLEANGVFSFEKPFGVIPAKSSRQLNVQFLPKNPINYYKRVYLLIGNQNNLYLDLFGSGYTSTKRPIPFSISNLNAYYSREKYNLHIETPEELDVLIKVNDGDQEGTVTEEQVKKSQQFINCLKIAEKQDFVKLSAADTMRRFFIPVTSTQNPISIEHKHISFGSCSRFKLQENKSVVVRNNTYGKVTCEPHLPDNCPFVVFPQTYALVAYSNANSIDIKARSTHTFKIGFRPDVDNQFYSSEIDFVCYFKSNRTFRLVTEKTFTPPWTASLRVSGNTFEDSDSFIPHPLLTPSTNITFPSCLVGESVYRTVTIRNGGDVPMLFEFVIGDLFPTFECKPSTGIVPRNSFQIVAFQFLPKEVGVFKGQIKCILNESMANVSYLNVFGGSYLPKISLQDDGKLYFKPTHLGAIHSKTFTITNPSRIPALFEWEVPDGYTNVFSVDNPSGILRGNESLQLKWNFAPKHKMSYVVKITCKIFTSDSSNEDDRQVADRVVLTVMGEGITGGLSLGAPVLDFGTVLIAHDAVQHLTVYNSSDCAIPYQFVVVEQVNGVSILSQAKLTVSGEDIGVLEARSHKEVSLVYAPQRRTIDRFNVYCVQPLSYKVEPKEIHLQTFKETQKTKKVMTPSLDYTIEQLDEFPKCEVIGIGSQPHIGITDIRADESQKTDLWEQFSVNQINDELLREFEGDKTSTAGYTATAVSTFQDTIKGMTQYMFDFGARQVDSPETVVYINFSNLGKLPADLSFNFPYDAMIEVDRWAQHQAPKNSGEETELSIILNQLFVVEPRKTHLEPGEDKVVKFTYRHTIADTHTVPVLVQILEGVSFVVAFKGQTLVPGQRFLHFRSLDHEFAPVQIGSKDAPLQYYTLKNTSDEPIEYSIDTEPLDTLFNDNYNYPIIKLENPTGRIAENGGTSILRFIFQPLEIKRYTVELAIRVTNGDTYYITFAGEGIDKNNKPTLDPVVIGDAVVQHLPHVVPSLQLISGEQGQLTSLSMEVVDFGIVPSLSCNRRLVVLRNTSSIDSISFNWDTALPVDNSNLSATLSIEPQSKSLEPNEFVVCKFVLSAGSRAQILDVDICCHITNETRKERKEVRRKRYEQSLLHRPSSVEDGDTPNIIKKTQTKRQSIVDRVTIARSGTLKQPLRQKPKFNPILMPNEKTGTSRRPDQNTLSPAEDDDDKYGMKELKNLKIYVRIQGTVVPLEEFKNEYKQDSWLQSYIPVLGEHNSRLAVDERKTSAGDTIPYESLGAAIRGKMDDGKSFLSGILADLLQEVIHDEGVANATDFDDAENNPFFCQFSSTPRPSRPQSAASQLREELVTSRPSSAFGNPINTNAGLPALDYDAGSTPISSRSNTSSVNSTRGAQQPTAEPKEILKQPEVQQIIEWILAESSFKIISEALHEQQ